MMLEPQTKIAIDTFFEHYNSWGRSFLDFLHFIFNNIFNVLLVFAALLSLLYIIMSVYVLFMKKKQRKQIELTSLPMVSVQIPTYNELVALRCAKSCLEFDYPKNKYEILIGDDSNDAEVSRKIDEFASLHKGIVKVLRRDSNTGYKSGNLNNMLKHTKGDIIAIFDSDFVPPKDFLSKIVQPFADERVAGVQSKWNFMNSEQNLISVLGTTIVEVFQRITLPFMYERRRLAFLCGSAEAVRKKALIELGGWDHGNLTEDIEFSLRLLKNGYKIEYMEELMCDSEVPYVPKDLYKQQMRWAYGVISSYLKHAGAILRSKKITLSDKMHISLLCSGYLMTALIASLFIMGFLSVITHPPAPIDFGKFFIETGRNILLTSGLMAASAVTLSRASRKRMFFRMLGASFSYGLIVGYHVNIGIIKAIAKKPMKWYMLNKSGNSIS